MNTKPLNPIYCAGVDESREFWGYKPHLGLLKWQNGSHASIRHNRQCRRDYCSDVSGDKGWNGEGGHQRRVFRHRINGRKGLGNVGVPMGMVLMNNNTDFQLQKCCYCTPQFKIQIILLTS